ncbi:MAG: hypothetical protein HKO81_04825 [Flavobacteriaceae bacterium]|nr:hypothetical protein [Flavobacteriaceae bacterium]
MKTLMPNIKYIESKSPDELHVESLNWISELKFIKDEQHFLDELLKNYTLQLIENIEFSKNKDIISKLSKIRKTGEKLLKKLINHENELLILVDGIDQIKEEKHYRFLHSTYLLEVTNYFNDYKTIKRKIFTVVKKIMKQEKQKRLLN